MENYSTAESLHVPSIPQKDNTNRLQAMKSHRTVRLTVLPPLNGTTNTTISHDGLIEVEQTHQTVDEAHREHMAKMMNLWKLEQQQNKTIKNNTENSSVPKAEKRIGTIKVISGKHLQTSNSRNNAIFAAVGAGMIPATMAMLLPVVLGRHRRHTEEEEHFSVLSSTSVDSEDSKRIRKKPNRKLNQRKKTQVVYF